MIPVELRTDRSSSKRAFRRPKIRLQIGTLLETGNRSSCRSNVLHAILMAQPASNRKHSASQSHVPFVSARYQCTLSQTDHQEVNSCLVTPVLVLPSNRVISLTSPLSRPRRFSETRDDGETHNRLSIFAHSSRETALDR